MRRKFHGKRRKTRNVRCGFPPSTRVTNPFNRYDLEEEIANLDALIGPLRRNLATAPGGSQELAWAILLEDERNLEQLRQLEQLRAAAAEIVARTSWDHEGYPASGSLKVTYVPPGSDFRLKPGQLPASAVSALASRTGELSYLRPVRTAPSATLSSLRAAAHLSVAGHPASARRAETQLRRLYDELLEAEQTILEYGSQGLDVASSALVASAIRDLPDLFDDLDHLPPGPVRDFLLDVADDFDQPGADAVVSASRTITNLRHRVMTAANAYREVHRPGTLPSAPPELLDLASKLHDPAPRVLMIDGPYTPDVPWEHELSAGRRLEDLRSSLTEDESRTGGAGRLYTDDGPLIAMPAQVQRARLQEASRCVAAASDVLASRRSADGSDVLAYDAGDSALVGALPAAVVEVAASWGDSALVGAVTDAIFGTDPAASDGEAAKRTSVARSAIRAALLQLPPSAPKEPSPPLRLEPEHERDGRGLRVSAAEDRARIPWPRPDASSAASAERLSEEESRRLRSLHDRFASTVVEESTGAFFDPIESDIRRPSSAPRVEVKMRFVDTDWTRSSDGPSPSAPPSGPAPALDDEALRRHGFTGHEDGQEI